MKKDDKFEMSDKDKMVAVIAIEEGKKHGVTPFQAGVMAGISKIIRGDSKNKKRNNKR